MNLLFIVDKWDWAFGRIAQNIKTGLNEFNVDIICTDTFESIPDFVHYLHKNIKERTILHFFWRDYLLEVMNIVQQHPEYHQLLLSNKVTTHIPDHLFTDKESEHYRRRIPLMNFVDGYFVTSLKLKECYLEFAELPAPHSIIYDNPAIPIDKVNYCDTHKIPTIVWIGNSKWGEYLGFEDYKGLNTIILPALAKLQTDGYQFNYIEFDSSKSKAEREVILDTLANADILLISSRCEGTPLPLLEGMANGCAIVTTDVGIAKEILPQLQHSYIVPRDKHAFYTSLKQLINENSLLLKIQQQNHLAYCQQFGNVSLIASQWSQFFQEILLKEPNQFKANFLTITAHQAGDELQINEIVRRSFKRQLAVNTIYFSSKVALKLNLMKTLKRSKWVRRLYHRVAFIAATPTLAVDDVNHIKAEPYSDYDQLDQVYTNALNGKKVIAFYSGYWSGVATSTASFFKKNSLPFPYFSHEYPQMASHVYLERLANKLATSPTLRSIIMSGGTELQMALTQKVKQQNPNLKIYFAWHGSPAQWVDDAQYSTFDAWYKLYQQRSINGIISFKPSLDNILKAYQIPSYSVANYIVQNTPKEKLSAPNTQNYRIGLFAAIFSWYKNPFPQLLAIGAVEGGELVTNLPLTQNMNWVTSKIKLSMLTENLENQQFINLLGTLHVVCYVTNTECSPMIALEAVGIGTPCLVGPAGNIYKGFPELEYYLVEPEVDNPAAIHQRLQLIRNDYSKVKKLLTNYVIEYNTNLEQLKKDLYKKLSQ